MALDYYLGVYRLLIFHFLSKACEHLATGTVYANFRWSWYGKVLLNDDFFSGEVSAQANSFHSLW